MLRNHGLLTVGSMIADAFLAMYIFESACQIQIAAQAGGSLIAIDESIQASAEADARSQTGGMGGRFVWPALLRKLERTNPGYDV